MTTSYEAGESSGPKFSLFWGIYGQVAAILGAITFLVFISHFVDVGLKGVVREAFEWWVVNVRPLVGQPIQWLVQQTPETWRFEVPDAVKDYVAGGIVTALSWVRAQRVVVGPNRYVESGSLALAFIAWPSFVAMPLFLSLTLFGLFVAKLFRGIDVGSGSPSFSEWLSSTIGELLPIVSLSALPVVYLLLILVANIWLV